MYRVDLNTPHDDDGYFYIDENLIETREIIKEYFNSKKLKELNIDNFLIPDDNETIYFK